MTRKIKDNNSLLWKLKIPDKPSSYIYGTMHSGNQWLDQKIKPLLPFIRQAVHFFGETDIDAIKYAKDFNEFQWAGLKTIFNKNQYLKISGLLRLRLALDINYLNQEAPMILISTICEKMLNPDQLPFMDQKLWSYAKANGLPCAGLETVLEQKQIYQRIPEQAQIKLLKHFLSSLSKSLRNTNKILKAYLEDDLTTLYINSRAHLGGLKSKLLYNRNEIFAFRITSLMQADAQSNFFCLGAAHLPGQKGILRKLKLAGVTVSPVCLIYS